MFRADYYNTLDLSGPIALSRCESQIRHSWSWMAPLPGVLHDFSVRWTGKIELPAGKRHFKTISDDGIRVKLNGKVILENWTMHAPTVDRASAYVHAGVHTIVVEYYDGIYDATAKLFIR